MPRYLYDVSLSRQKRFINRFKKFLFFILVMMIVAIIVVAVDSFNQSIHNDTEIGAPSVSTVKTNTHEFTNDYFSFTAPTSWSFIEKESTEDTYKYLSTHAGYVDNGLTIYVNKPSADLSGTRVLPVRIDENQNIIPGEVSDHCNTASAIKKSNHNVLVTIAQVKMLCQLDSSNFLLVVGIRGGDTNITMKRKDGSVITFGFFYRSSTVPADANPIINILNTFAAH